MAQPGIPGHVEGLGHPRGGAVSPTALTKAAYGALFAVGVPALLVVWAVATERLVTLPAPRAPLPGLALMAAGTLLAALATLALAVHGGGLPMNAFPPPRLVTRGVYRWLAHPIYAGFTLAVLGAAVAAGSASGLWLVAPAAALGGAALVLGYERQDLRRRFGEALPRPFLSLPAAAERAPALGERLVALSVLAAWAVLYEAIALLGAPRGAFSTFLPFERAWPVWEVTELVYAATYLFVVAAVFAARSATDLRRFALRGLISMAVVFPLFLAVPAIAPPRPFEPHGPLGALLLLERHLDTPAAAFPSYHVIWALLAAECYRRRGLARAFALAIAASCVTTGMHSLLDVLAGLAVGLALLRLESIWEWLRRRAERLANSFREWRLGPARVINHGAYAAAGTAFGLAYAGVLLGPGHLPGLLLVATCGLLGAGLWAQALEGSAKLLRPFGYYGGVLGVGIGCLLAAMIPGESGWLLLAALATAAPWIQAAGRLRCLVQGCCHGRRAPEAIGIRHTHPRSRVVRLADLAGVPLHPTALYSILWNLPVGLLLARLWIGGAALGLIAGVYLVLLGLERFVEESYRGEPQTRIVAGLRIYQWLAVASVLAGIALMCVCPAIAAPAPILSVAPLLVALPFGLVTGAALGVDFPSSNRRFSRLV